MIRILLSFLFGITLAISANAQREDFRTWFTIGLEKEFFNRLNISVVPELRLSDNSSRLDALLTEIDLSVKVTGFLQLGGYYRYEYDKRIDGNHDNVNRLAAYAGLNKDISNFRFAYRAMYQAEYENYRTEELGWLPVTTHRHRISVKYRKKSWDIVPGVSAEGFFKISPPWVKNQERLRLSAGFAYHLTKKIDLSLEYKFQQEFSENDPLKSHILSIGAEFEL